LLLLNFGKGFGELGFEQHGEGRSRKEKKMGSSEVVSLSSQVTVALALTMVGGLSTALGGLVVVLQPTPNLKRLGLMQGLAAGLMFSISFLDLMHNAINAIGFARANLWFFGGVLLFAGIVTLIPEPSLSPSQNAAVDAVGKGNNNKKGKQSSILTRQRRRQVMMSGIVTAVGIGLHNFPEGIAVFLGSIKGLRVGISLALAIALHNIPEGVAVALPIYFATESRWKAFQLAAASGLAEPLGVILVALLFPRSLSADVLEGMLAGVGGIMAFLTLHEMIPLAFEYAGHRQAVGSIFVGMVLMSISLYLLELSVPHSMI
jgi:ZIP family zinc transporter